MKNMCRPTRGANIEKMLYAKKTPVKIRKAGHLSAAIFNIVAMLAAIVKKKADVNHLGTERIRYCMLEAASKCISVKKKPDTWTHTRRYTDTCQKSRPTPVMVKALAPAKAV